MKFWDSSAIVPLLIQQGRTSQAQSLYKEDPLVMLWWGSDVECTGTIARLVGEGALGRSEEQAAFERLGELQHEAHEIQPSAKLQQIAKRLLRTHILRSADALQLAAVLSANELSLSSLPFVCFDERLGLVAQREGLRLAELVK